MNPCATKGQNAKFLSLFIMGNNPHRTGPRGDVVCFLVNCSNKQRIFCFGIIFVSAERLSPDFVKGAAMQVWTGAVEMTSVKI